MTECPNCGHKNRVGEIICVRCGTNLLTGKQSSSTKQLDEAEQEQVVEQFGEEVLQTDDQFDSVFPEGGILRLEIVGSPLPIQVKFQKDEIILGRRDPATGALPDVDLAPFAGYRMGVSRRHSEIRKSEEGYLELLDLGSSNGTFLNGQPLESHTPYRINNRDRISLGQITMQVIYRPDLSTSINEVVTVQKTPSQPAPSAPAEKVSQPKTGGEPKPEAKPQPSSQEVKSADESQQAPGISQQSATSAARSSKLGPLDAPTGKITERNIDIDKILEDEAVPSAPAQDTSAKPRTPAASSDLEPLASDSTTTQRNIDIEKVQKKYDQSSSSADSEKAEDKPDAPKKPERPKPAFEAKAHPAASKATPDESQSSSDDADDDKQAKKDDDKPQSS